MSAFGTVLCRGFDRVERALDAVFGPEWNPMAQLGTLGWFLFWIVTATGVYLFIFFDTGVVNAYTSIEWLTNDHWFHAGIARSFHRYASDLMIAVMLVHLVREFARGRHRGARWFSWITGVPLIWLVYICGITGYWLVWDRLAQYVAIASTELLDWLPIFGEPVARNFLTPDALSGRFFTLLVFLHIAVPLILLLVMWIHIQRITNARTAPSRELGGMVLAGLLIASLLLPARSQAAADLAKVPAQVGIDWFVLPLYPVMDLVPAGVIWAGVVLFTVGITALPWLPPKPRPAPVEVFLDHCNGCNRCVEDCPYGAVTLVPRTDGAPFPHQAEVDPDRCVACGICMGSCPSSTPFRRSIDLVTGIDLPDLSLKMVREQVIEAAETLEGAGRVLTLACAHGAAGRDMPGRVVLPCVAMTAPSLIDFILSRDLADGVAIAGCAERECQHRFGIEWTEQRIAATRDPYLRARVPRARLATIWAGPTETARLARELGAFQERLAALPADVRPSAGATRQSAQSIEEVEP
ncbi:cytochrome b N-terminal domain-containing protein [Aurantimonas marina]|uniref:cytochrome b N-terminal domain-containing protein n=1 Tax=Aurantimonas marina TaxID=2780508 RepID=UPI0019D296A4|nr:cytochrome b N-terminal domain-containing protein [Aurantimonas marina]